MPQQEIIISDRRKIIEIIAVVITALGKFVFMDYLNWRLGFVVIAILGWMSYIIYRWKRQSCIVRYWGFRTDNFKQVLLLVLPFGITAVLLSIGIGCLQGSINLTWHIIPILIAYPLWGIIQQFLIIALVAGNLNAINSIKIKKSIVVLATALVFAIVHYPLYWLMIGTFILALFYGFVYLKQKNIYVLGIFHGWLGAIFYYTVIGSDPYAEIFLKLFN